MNKLNYLLSRRNSAKNLLAGLFFLTGLIFFSFWGPVELVCDRDSASQARWNCSIIRFVAFGFIKSQEVSIQSLSQVKINIKTRTKYNISKESTSSNLIVSETLTYGVLLTGDRDVILNGYIENRNIQEKRVEEINELLETMKNTRFKYTVRNFWTDFTTILLFLISGFISLQDRFFVKPK